MAHRHLGRGRRLAPADRAADDRRRLGRDEWDAVLRRPPSLPRRAHSIHPHAVPRLLAAPPHAPRRRRSPRDPKLLAASARARRPAPPRRGDASSAPSRPMACSLAGQPPPPFFPPLALPPRLA